MNCNCKGNICNCYRNGDSQNENDRLSQFSNLFGSASHMRIEDFEQQYNQLDRLYEQERQELLRLRHQIQQTIQQKEEFLRAHSGSQVHQSYNSNNNDNNNSNNNNYHNNNSHNNDNHNNSNSNNSNHTNNSRDNNNNNSNNNNSSNNNNNRNNSNNNGNVNNNREPREEKSIEKPDSVQLCKTKTKKKKNNCLW